MKAAQPILLVPFFLALPFTAAAQRVPIHAIGYEGTILEVSNAPAEYAVGDRIAGQLLIDRRVGWGGTLGLNEASYGSQSPAFVSGFWPSAGDGFDNVFIANDVLREGGEGPIDILSVSDWLVGTNASQDSGREFSISARLHGFLGSPKLDRLNVHDITSADVDEPDESLSGRISFRIDIPSFVRFAIDRLTVRPGACVAP